MKIETYLSQLLFRHQCVIVPNFGAFLTDFQSATIDKNNNTIYPPRKVISFNANLVNNDGLLANHIAQHEKISFEAALENIKTQVRNWQHSLYQIESISLENIGKIAVNAERNLVFEAFPLSNFCSNSFGLSSLSAAAVKRELSKNEILNEPAEEVEEVAVISLQANKKPIYKYINAAILIIAIGLAGILGNNYYNEQIALKTQLVEVAVQKEVQNKIQEATFFISNPLPNVTLTVKETEMSFHVVAGAFRKESNAQRIFEKLNKQGFNARRLTKNGHGFYPVLFGSYSTYAEAHTALLTIRKTESPEAWLMIKKL